MPSTPPIFPFLSLPPEIRLKIYRLAGYARSYVLLSPAPGWHLKSWTPPPPQLPTYPENLLLTCHQIYHEARGLYFNTNRFDMLLSRYSPLFVFSRSFRDNRRRIRTLRLRIWRWGSNDGFVSILAPIIEDMILNGTLRDLEVWVKWRDLSGLVRMGQADVGVEDLSPAPGMAANVRALLRLCEDPYLERVRLVAFDAARGNEILVLGEEEDLASKDISSLLKRSWPSKPMSRK